MGWLCLLSLVSLWLRASTHFLAATSPARLSAISTKCVLWPRSSSTSCFTIALSELYRSLVGWVPPPKVEKYFGGELNVGYYPGDIGFDPLGLKPTEPTEFAEMQTKELQNGRLAML